MSELLVINGDVIDIKEDGAAWGYAERPFVVLKPGNALDYQYYLEKKVVDDLRPKVLLKHPKLMMKMPDKPPVLENRYKFEG